MARIRTIKPEFWTNEAMCGLPDFTRLLALALLNYADDHGYFYANPLLIRGAMFPLLTEVSSIQAGLCQLAGIGYLALRVSPDGRQYGSIVNFAIHQRVDKAKTSLIADRFRTCQEFQDQSTTHPGSIQDQSTLEGKGKEGKGKYISCQGVGTPESLPPSKDGGKAIQPKSYPAEFEEFWRAYPMRGGRLRGKETTYKLWLKVPEADRVDLLTAAVNYATSREAVDGFAKDPARFFKDNWWRDWIEEAAAIPRQNGNPVDEPEDWVRTQRL